MLFDRILHDNKKKKGRKREQLRMHLHKMAAHEQRPTLTKAHFASSTSADSPKSKKRKERKRTRKKWHEESSSSIGQENNEAAAGVHTKASAFFQTRSLG